jgi:hypothetical protein
VKATGYCSLGFATADSFAAGFRNNFE